MPRRPRWIRPDTAACATQRTVDRQFLFRPGDELRNLVGACAGRAQQRYPVKVFWLDLNINHKHSAIAPLSGSPEHLRNLVKFDRLFNSLLARGINRSLGREGPLFSSRNRAAEARDDASLERQLLYAVTNPVKDGLVERVAHWKGFSSYRQLSTGEVERFTYVDWSSWHRAGGGPVAPHVRQAELVLSPIPAWEHMPAEKRQALFRRRVRELEQEYRAERERESRGVVGAKRLSKLDPRSRPSGGPERRGRIPECHASSAKGVREYREELRGFLDAFRVASSKWLSGVRDVVFPAGSYRPPLVEVVT